jgi:hypothetical protein
VPPILRSACLDRETSLAEVYVLRWGEYAIGAGGRAKDGVAPALGRGGRSCGELEGSEKGSGLHDVADCWRDLGKRYGQAGDAEDSLIGRGGKIVTARSGFLYSPGQMPASPSVGGCPVSDLPSYPSMLASASSFAAGLQSLICLGPTGVTSK